MDKLIDIKNTLISYVNTAFTKNVELKQNHKLLS
jgi:hypothetical protein